MKDSYPACPPDARFQSLVLFSVATCRKAPSWMREVGISTSHPVVMQQQTPSSERQPPPLLLLECLAGER